MAEAILLLTYGDGGPEIIHTADCVRIIQSAQDYGARLVWIRGAAGGSSTVQSGDVSDGDPELAVYGVDTNFSESVQRILTTINMLTARYTLRCIHAFGLGCGARLGIVVGRVLKVPTLLSFNILQACLAASLSLYTLRWCLDKADYLIASSVPAYHQVADHLTAGRVLHLEAAGVHGRAKNGERLYVADSRYCYDREVVKDIRQRVPGAHLLDMAEPAANAENFSRYCVDEVFSVGSEADLIGMEHFITSPRIWVVPRSKPISIPQGNDHWLSFSDLARKHPKYYETPKAGKISYPEMYARI